MDVNNEDSQALLASAILDMNMSLARTLILDNSVRPVGVNDENMFQFVRNAALLRDRPLLRQLLTHNSRLGGKVLWTLLDDAETATMMVVAGAAVNVRQNPCGMLTFLHVLSASGGDPRKIQLAELMIDRGADVNAVDINRRSVLNCAIRGGAPNDYIRKLLLLTADNFAKNLTDIVECNRTADLLPLFLTAGTGDEVAINRRARLAIFHLILLEHENVDLIDTIFESYNVAVDAFDEKGYTLLHNALMRANTEMVELLLKRNADPNKKTWKGRLPLWIASVLQDSSISALLIKYGADVNRCDGKGQRPIHSACKGSSFSNIVLLTRLGAEVNVADNRGQTPFSLLPDEFIPSAFVIRQLAIAASRGTEINARDMSLIRTRGMQLVYYSSFNEIQRMQRIETTDGIPYYTFLIGSIESTSRFTRRQDFTSNFENLAVLKELFPNYFFDLRNAFVFAKEREDRVIAKEQFLDEIFTEIFQVPLPYPIINKIAYYLCTDVLNHFVADFHSSMFPKMIWQ